MEQVSQSMPAGLLLAFSGGMLDAYTYLNRGRVFATAETGNLVLLGLSLAQGEWGRIFMYLPPVLAFAAGVLAAEWVRRKWAGKAGWLHWQQGILLAECGLLVLAGALPVGGYDRAVNCMISFISAVQMESFRQFRGCASATTMCTGNLRSGTEQLFRALFTREPPAASRAATYYLLILSFVAGAVACGGLSQLLAGGTVALACLPLLVVFGLLSREGRNVK